ncbi:MAG: hypothetical protein A2X19_08095 [Bacteroidetes bacterium GWE2_39_28]|nr:MAG: hypothetical protein A2X19_08095 [Bacteroidetes bacterium GWE2_39_28]OFY13241.1 MAG: hypothetical protein A2X16_04930 [Bacteroidetes bacterium GWF2_39_10]OFZ08696.1 MAG: hypothetical protein A2322_07455 [Bacteroidetes bacterium RIFOXYB2_FULL_39_7]OFZ09589.1 MAG: hypothetical protein A2465_07870 [Bacteroidetes bacterium RIFOXYC2_FULL_39_11]HCT94309.1 hypothetical protein [Rikenellaceae bacterium]
MKYFKNIYRFTLLLLALNITVLASLQGQGNNSILFKAMEDEMNRSKNELTLPNSPSPFFVAYTVGDISYTSVISSKGTTIYTKVSPKERLHSVNLYVGDSKFSSDYAYSGNGILTTSMTVTENNYDQLRRSFWQTSDIAYKMAVEVFNSKQNAIKSANLTEQEKNLPDMLPLAKPVVNVAQYAQNLATNKYEELANKLSAELAKYNSIFDSRVEIDAIVSNYHYISTEGTKTVEPAGYVAVTFKGKVRNAKGQVLRDEEVLYSKTFETLPAEKDLTLAAAKFAAKLTALINSTEMEEYYLGPVLFIEDAAAQILAENLISPAGVFAYRRPIQVMATAGRPENVSARRDIKALEERINKKVIDSRISVKNMTDSKTFGNTPLIGYYSIDAQGVIPQKETSLIENGILRNLLSTRVPTKTSSASTGSLRFGTRPRAIPLEVAPGNLIISVKEGTTTEELKKNLIKAAIEEGLDYAYIVKKIANQTDQYIYKVFVKDGSETLVTGAEVTPVPLTKLKRVLGLNQNQKIYNYLYQGTVPVSVIYPDGILIEDIEINRKPVNVQKDSPLIVKK